MSTKVHPNTSTTTSSSSSEKQQEPSVLTVWCKSLLFNCRGFTVFDPKGRLLFRVDTYSSSSSSSPILLMDAAGEPLLTIRRKGLWWEVRRGEEEEEKSAPVFEVRRALLPWGEEVARVRGAAAGYVVEGSYGRRSCRVREEGKGRRRVVAELQRKEGVGRDVFRLAVWEDGIHAAAAMALVVVLHQIFGST